MPDLHADNPACWAVIYNADLADSAAWMAEYAARRSIPAANRIGLPLPVQEIITQSQFFTMRSSIDAYLTEHDLQDQILGLICGHGVPGVYLRPDNMPESIPSQMQRMDGSTTSLANPLHPGEGQPLVRPTHANLNGFRLTARIDGSSLASSVAWLDRAAAVESATLGDNDAIWLDPVCPDDPLHNPIAARMYGWAGGLDRQLTRLPLRLPEAGNQDFTVVANDGFFWGWDQAAPPWGLFGSPAGSRIFGVQLRFGSATLGSLRQADGSWGAVLGSAGYAAIAGCHAPVSASSIADVRSFFAALREEWTLGEAWFAASPFLRAGWSLIGDPLMRISLPRGGWDIHGPFPDIPGIELDQPAMALRESEREAALSMADGSRGIWVIRHRDAQGQVERGARLVRWQRSGDRALTLPQLPAWPAISGWRPRQIGGAWEIIARWAECCGSLNVDRVGLIEQVDSMSEQLVEESVPGPWQRSVRWQRIPAGQPVRYRVRALTQEGIAEETGWSEWLTLLPDESRALELI